MKSLKKYNIICAVLMVMALFSACERTELCYDHYPKASLSFMWERQWERDYGMGHAAAWDAGRYGMAYADLHPSTPEWVNLVMFKNNAVVGEHFMSPAGDDILFDLEGGEYSFLLYNGDTEYIVLSDFATVGEARASATPRSRASISSVLERHPDTKSANPPDILYAAYIEKVPQVKAHEETQLQIKMQPLVYTYLIRYEFEEGIQHVHMARGALAGMAESVYLRDGRTSDNAAIILYDCDIKDYGCEARVRSFGVPAFPDEYYGRAADDAPERPYTLNLEVLLTNGTTKEFNIDIADQIKKQPRGGVITVSGLRVEDEENKTPISDGFDVDLSGWGTVDVDLPLPDYHDD